MGLQIVPFSFYFVKSGSLFIVCQTHTRTKVLPSSVFAPVTLIETETFRPANRSIEKIKYKLFEDEKRKFLVVTPEKEKK